ncbi:MAG: HPr family phosphocarrier protein [bacterium]
MCVKHLTIEKDVGLNLLECTRIAQAISEYRADVFISKDDNRVNARSILDSISLEAKKGDELMITANGEDEKEVIVVLERLVVGDAKSIWNQQPRPVCKNNCSGGCREGKGCQCKTVACGANG